MNFDVGISRGSAARIAAESCQDREERPNARHADVGRGAPIIATGHGHLRKMALGWPF
jgi:hypothetical protein